MKMGSMNVEPGAIFIQWLCGVLAISQRACLFGPIAALGQHTVQATAANEAKVHL